MYASGIAEGYVGINLGNISKLLRRQSDQIYTKMCEGNR